MDQIIVTGNAGSDRNHRHEMQTVMEAGLDLLHAGLAVTGFALNQRLGGGAPSRLIAIWTRCTTGRDLSLIDASRGAFTDARPDRMGESHDEVRELPMH